jgi:hypothetical protein
MRRLWVESLGNGRGVGATPEEVTMELWSLMVVKSRWLMVPECDTLRALSVHTITNSKRICSFAGREA